MAVDFTLGLLISFVIKKNTNSKRAFFGLIKKTAMIMMVIVAVQVDSVTDSGMFMRNTMILFLIGMEGISFIENLGHLGIKVPKFLNRAFEQLQIQNDDKDSKDGDKK